MTAYRLGVLRVAVDDTQEKFPLVRTHIEYQGISANSWFKPKGIQEVSTKERESIRPCQKVKKDASSAFLSPKIPQLPEACRTTLTQRAKTASSMLGRRHYDSENQNCQFQFCIVI